MTGEEKNVKSRVDADRENTRALREAQAGRDAIERRQAEEQARADAAADDLHGGPIAKFPTDTPRHVAEFIERAPVPAGVGELDGPTSLLVAGEDVTDKAVTVEFYDYEEARPVIESKDYAIDPADSFHLFEAILNADETHESSKMFYDCLIQAGLLHAKKQRDYGKVGDPFANVRSTAEFGVSGWVGAMIRLNDKVKRLQALARNGELHNEGAIDSFMDIAVYALIARVLYQEEGGA